MMGTILLSEILRITGLRWNCHSKLFEELGPVFVAKMFKQYLMEELGLSVRCLSISKVQKHPRFYKLNFKDKSVTGDITLKELKNIIGKERLYMFQFFEDCLSPEINEEYKEEMIDFFTEYINEKYINAV